MPGPVLRLGADVEHDHIPFAEPGEQLLAGHRVELGAVAEVRRGQPVELGDVLGGDVAQRRPELGDPWAAQPVVDAQAVPPAADETGAQQVLQVLGGVGDALVDLGGDLLDVPLALGEQVDDLRAPAVAERLGRRGQAVEQPVLRRPATTR